MATISIITPWLNNPQLIQTYEPSVRGAEQVIVIDNGSNPEARNEIQKMVDRLGGVCILNQKNELFSKANNQGLAVANCDIVMFLNNDIKAPEGWLDNVRKDVTEDVIAGPSILSQTVDGRKLPFVEGWCMVAYRKVWEKLGGWNETDYKGLYWEDNDICFRAMLAGYGLKETNWPVWHFNNFTSRNTPGAYDYSAHNQAVFEAKVRATI